MQHSDPELLALYALGETVDPAVVDHIDACPECSEDLTSLRHVVRSTAAGAVSASAGTVAPVSPPRSVWEHIARETSINPDLLPRDGVVSAPLDGLASRRRLRTGRAPASRTLLVAASVAALGVAAGIGGTLLWQARDDSSAQVTATVALAPLGAQGLSGGAEVVTASSDREIVVRLDRSAAPAGFLEVWLLSPDASEMVSLGVLEGDEGTFALPTDLDLSAYPLLDVSVEPYDGNPLHSGDSVARGDLDHAT